MAELFANIAASTLDVGIDDNDLSLDVVDASDFPASGNFRIVIGSEIMLVTAVASETFTVTRGAEGTVAAAHLAGVPVTHVLTAGGLAQTISENVATFSNEYEICSNDTVFNSASWTDVVGCGVTLTAGTWLVMATCTLRNNGGSNTTGALKLYYDTTDLVAAEYSVTAGFNVIAHISAIVTLAGTEDVILAGRQQGAVEMRALEFGDPNTGAASIPGTNISAIKLSA